MNTTLNKIKAFLPCQIGWTTLLRGLGKTDADDEPLPLTRILEINGIRDAIWALRTCPEALPNIGEFAKRAAERAKGYAAAADRAAYAAYATYAAYAVYAREREKQRADYIELFGA